MPVRMQISTPDKKTKKSKKNITGAGRFSHRRPDFLGEQGVDTVEELVASVGPEEANARVMQHLQADWYDS